MPSLSEAEPAPRVSPRIDTRVQPAEHVDFAEGTAPEARSALLLRNLLFCKELASHYTILPVVQYQY